MQLLIAAHSYITTEMKIIPITKIEVINTITSLKTSNLSGYDDNILINCTNVISKPFTFTPTPHSHLGFTPRGLILPLYGLYVRKRIKLKWGIINHFHYQCPQRFRNINI